jgi:DNA-binding CsgD family transcriptional regulator
MQLYPDSPLASSDYDRILSILGECGGARTLTGFRETLIESLATRFGYRHANLLLGPTRGRIFQDAGALTLGRAGRLVPSYLEHFHRFDPLAQLVARRGVPATGRTLVLDQTRPYLNAENHMFLQRHLYQGGFHAVLCTEATADVVHLGLALFHEQESAFGVRDLAVMRRLGQLLARQAALLTRLPQEPAWLTRLTGREAEVARLVGRGCTNQDIAAVLHITVDTVKKHVGRACLKAHATNRTDLAARLARGA